MVESKELLILLDQRILRLHEDSDQCLSVQSLQRYRNRHASDELRNQSELHQILRSYIRIQLACLALYVGRNLCVEADALFVQSGFHDPLDAVKGAAADEQNVRRVNRNQLLLRVLPSALGRNTRYCAFHDLQQCLLYALSRNVAGNRYVFTFLRDLVDFIQIYNTELCPFNIIISRLNQL